MTEGGAQANVSWLRDTSDKSNNFPIHISYLYQVHTKTNRELFKSEGLSLHAAPSRLNAAAGAE